MTNVPLMGIEARLGVVLREAAALLPGDLGRHLMALVSPESLGRWLA